MKMKPQTRFGFDYFQSSYLLNQIIYDDEPAVL